MTEQLLVLTAPIELEAKLVDVVDAACDTTGLIRAEVSMRRNESRGLSNEDQVMGRSRSIELRIAVDETVVATLIATLRQRLPHRGLRFQVLPIIQEGEIE